MLVCSTGPPTVPDRVDTELPGVGKYCGSGAGGLGAGADALGDGAAVLAEGAAAAADGAAGPGDGAAAGSSARLREADRSAAAHKRMVFSMCMFL
jgi:hypothetical protein